MTKRITGPDVKPSDAADPTGLAHIGSAMKARAQEVRALANKHKKNI